MGQGSNDLEQVTDRAIGARLRNVRIIAGMTQEVVARQCGITFQQLQKYEMGINRISCSRLVTIANVLGVNPGAIFAGAIRGEACTHESIAAVEPLPRISLQDRRLLEALNALPEATRTNLAGGFIRTIDTLAATLASVTPERQAAE